MPAAPDGNWAGNHVSTGWTTSSVMPGAGNRCTTGPEGQYSFAIHRIWPRIIRLLYGLIRHGPDKLEADHEEIAHIPWQLADPGPGSGRRCGCLGTHLRPQREQGLDCAEVPRANRA